MKNLTNVQLEEMLIYKLEKEIINKDELIEIIRHIQSMINKHYMGE